MTTIQRTFTVNASPEVVIKYLKDFGNAEQWDPGTESCRRIDCGPIEVGATWHNVSKVIGLKTELIYTLNVLSSHKLVFVGANDTATSIDSIIARPSGTGTELTYNAEIEMRGLAKLAAPAVKFIFERLGTDTKKQLTEVLNNL
jgi:carbon monoxide dehydrogenase subunit G